MSFAQTQAQKHITLTFTTPQGVKIDGELTPDLIPDGVAWRVFLRAVSELDNPSEVQLSRFLTKINRVGLDSTDTASMIKVLAHFDRDLKLADNAITTAINAHDSARLITLSTT